MQYDWEYAPCGIPHIPYARKMREVALPTEVRLSANWKKRVALLLIAIFCVSLAGVMGSQSSDSFPNGSGVLFIDATFSGPPNEAPRQIIQAVLSTTEPFRWDLGVQVQYVTGATIEQLRSLTSLDYRLIVFRVHAGPDAIVVNEPYSSWSFVYEQVNDEVGAMRLAGGGTYFTVTPKFITNEMSGTFRHKPIVIVEGCSALEDTGLAQAFLGKGAAAFVGWSTSVTLTHANLATWRVLEKLLSGKETLGNSVSETAAEIGPDPQTRASLLYYPPSADSILYGSN